MKSLIIKSFVAMATLLSATAAIGQTAELTVEVKGIKEAKGKILIAVKESENPQNTIYDMFEVTEEGSIICTLKNIPVGKVDVSIFQDMNDNYKLDMDEANIPVELCYTKEKVKINEAGNKLVAKLINVKEMMGSKPE